MTIKLDTWYEIEDECITHKMYHCFDEYCEEGLCTSSIKVKFKDGTESGWYHPPKDTVDAQTKHEGLFDLFKEGEEVC